jgi:hypothetical protein
MIVYVPFVEEGQPGVFGKAFAVPILPKDVAFPRFFGALGNMQMI